MERFSRAKGQPRAIARDAALRFGRGRHPASLNFGDCFSYALAIARSEPLLFVGDDFAKTDVAGWLSGQILATIRQMRFEIVVAPGAARVMEELPAFHRATIRDALETHLRHEPGKTSKSRIKRLRGLSQPQFRLRVDQFRVFYDISGQEVQILAIVAKQEAEAWLAEYGQGEA